MIKTLLTSAFIGLSILLAFSPIRAQQFKVNPRGSLVFRTNRSVTKTIEITRQDTLSRAYASRIYAWTDPDSSQFFTASVYPSSYEFLLKKDSSVDVPVTFHPLYGSRDTVGGLLYLSWADSIGHPFDTIKLIGILDTAGISDQASDYYDTLSILDTSEFEVQKVGDTAIRTIAVTNNSDQPLTIDTVQIMGNSHSCFDILSGLSGGQIMLPFQSDSFVVRYRANGATSEYVAAFTIDYHDSAKMNQSVMGLLQSNLVPAFRFALPDTLLWSVTDSTPVLNLDTIAPYVYLYGTVPITSFVSEATWLNWSGGDGSGGFVIPYSDSGYGGYVFGNETTNCPYVYMFSDNPYGDLSTYLTYSAYGASTGLNYNPPALDVESVVIPEDTSKWVTNLFHNQTIGIPLTIENSDPNLLSMPTTPMWLRNGTSDSLHVKLAKFWLGTNFTDSIYNSSTPFTLAPGQQVEVDFSLTPGTPDTSVIMDSTYYYYYDEFVVETDSSYELPLARTEPGGGAIPQARPLSGVNSPLIMQQPAMEVFPNPTFVSATLRYSLKEEASVSIAIFDALGRIVANPVVDEMESAGLHESSFPTDDLPPGLYSCRLRSGNFETVAKVVVMKR